MGAAIPYSEIDKFHEDSNFVFEKLVQYKVPVYCTVTVRSEFIDYQRKIKVTESLMDMLAPTSKWRLSDTVKTALRKQRGWIDNQAKDDELPVLTDSRIKEMKRIFLPRSQSGQVGWVEFCKSTLEGKLLLIKI